MMNEQVILVNEHDVQTGTMPKLEAHQKGLLHRAISVFIFNSQGELLLQQRALGKYHSAGLWSNTCCSHPRPGETPLAAAERRIQEEMGISVSLSFLYTFQYRADLENELIEHELDHVFWTVSDQAPQINPEEVVNFRYITIPDLLHSIEEFPQNYSEWFKICLEDVLHHLNIKVGEI
jgi:isopentenyl-diphosphate delta-isomerase